MTVSAIFTIVECALHPVKMLCTGVHDDPTALEFKHGRFGRLILLEVLFGIGRVIQLSPGALLAQRESLTQPDGEGIWATHRCGAFSGPQRPRLRLPSLQRYTAAIHVDRLPPCTLKYLSLPVLAPVLRTRALRSSSEAKNTASTERNQQSAERTCAPRCKILG
jgi:hypothetical protein